MKASLHALHQRSGLAGPVLFSVMAFLMLAS
jgi:hypothetical protein